MSRRESRSYKVLSKSGFLLLEILAALADGAKAAGKVSYKGTWSKSKTSYYRGLRELSGHRLIQKKKRKNKTVYVLTEAGQSLLRKPKYTARRSDGFSTVIIFDIPEEKSRQRTIFRRYLLRHGYSPLQKSVYVGPYKFNPEIEELVRELKISSHITTMDAKITYKL